MKRSPRDGMQSELVVAFVKGNDNRGGRGWVKNQSEPRRQEVGYVADTRRLSAID